MIQGYFTVCDGERSCRRRQPSLSRPELSSRPALLNRVKADRSGVVLVKVTTEKLPKSLMALDIELDRDQVEKGLDRAARRLSQKVNVPGFRKGKAPRFILENYFGREALVEEATDDLVNKAFRETLDQQQIEPYGPASLDGPPSFDEEPYHF